MMARVAHKGAILEKALDDTFGHHEMIGDIRGRGLFQALELVKDRETKIPFHPSNMLAKKIKAAALDEGLICYPMSGTRNGQMGDHILLAPPFIIEDEQIGELVSKLSNSIKKALKTTA